MSSRSLNEVRAAKEKLKGLVETNRAVNGIGISKDEDGYYFIKINLASESTDPIPKEVDGVPVAIETVGRIRPH